MSTERWRELNLANWEARVPVHLGPGGYHLAAFDDPGHLSAVVRYDLPRLGRLDGLDIVHLQCHLGTDTVSLARLGARSVTGLDFSPSALHAARTFAERAGASVEFVESDVYGAVEVLGASRFDLAYTGIGAIEWLPSISRWASVVAGLLRPGGRLFIRDTHPMLSTLCDPRPDGLLVVEYPYFENDGVDFTEAASYTGEGELASPELVHFNHGLSEIFNALWSAGLVITGFDEHREVPWEALGDQMRPSPDFDGEYVLATDPDRVPMTFTIQATKPIS